MSLDRKPKRKPPKPAQWALPTAVPRRRQESYLALIALVTVALWQIELGRMILYPFTLLATWFHEMGHGLASMALGARFEELVIYANGSGYALSSWPPGSSGFSHALTAAAGLLGPVAAGSIMIIVSRSRKWSVIALHALAALLVISLLFWVRSMAGWFVLSAFALAALLIGQSGKPKLQRFAIELLGVQAGISLWRDLGYLFSDGAIVGGQSSRSDTGAIADVLLFPYWFWGAVITATGALMLVAALRFASKR